MLWIGRPPEDRKSTRLNSSHTEIYTLSLHDALPISHIRRAAVNLDEQRVLLRRIEIRRADDHVVDRPAARRSEEHTSELQSHRDLHSFPTRRSSDLTYSPRRRESRRAAGTSSPDRNSAGGRSCCGSAGRP